MHANDIATYETDRKIIFKKHLNQLNHLPVSRRNRKREGGQSVDMHFFGIQGHLVGTI